jgi:hypothetical protein
MNMSTTDALPRDAGAVAGTVIQEEMERGIAAAQAGDKMGAHKVFEAVAAQNGDMAEVWVWLGGTSSNLDDAEAAFQRAVMLDPANEEANLGLRWVALRRQVTGRAGTSDLSTGSFDRASTNSLPSGSLKTEDVDKTVKVKVGKSGSRWWSNIPMAARLLFALSIILYALVLYFVLIAPMLAPK